LNNGDAMDWCAESERCDVRMESKRRDVIRYE